MLRCSLWPVLFDVLLVIFFSEVRILPPCFNFSAKNFGHKLLKQNLGVNKTFSFKFFTSLTPNIMRLYQILFTVSSIKLNQQIPKTEVG